MNYSPTLRCFDRAVPTVIKADGIYIYTKKGKILDTTAGGTSYAVLGWNNKKICRTRTDGKNHKKRKKEKSLII